MIRNGFQAKISKLEQELKERDAQMASLETERGNHAQALEKVRLELADRVTSLESQLVDQNAVLDALRTDGAEKDALLAELQGALSAQAIEMAGGCNLSQRIAQKLSTSRTAGASPEWANRSPEQLSVSLEADDAADGAKSSRALPAAGARPRETSLDMTPITTGRSRATPAAATPPPAPAFSPDGWDTAEEPSVASPGASPVDLRMKILDLEGERAVLEERLHASEAGYQALLAQLDAARAAPAAAADQAAAARAAALSQAACLVAALQAICGEAAAFAPVLQMHDEAREVAAAAEREARAEAVGAEAAAAAAEARAEAAAGEAAAAQAAAAAAEEREAGATARAERATVEAAAARAEAAAAAAAAAAQAGSATAEEELRAAAAAAEQRAAAAEAALQELRGAEDRAAAAALARAAEAESVTRALRGEAAAAAGRAAEAERIAAEARADASEARRALSSARAELLALRHGGAEREAEARRQSAPVVESAREEAGREERRRESAPLPEGSGGDKSAVTLGAVERKMKQAEAALALSMRQTEVPATSPLRPFHELGVCSGGEAG